MSDSAIERTASLRDDLLTELQQTDLYKAVQALDDAVFALGGARKLPPKIPFARTRTRPPHLDESADAPPSASSLAIAGRPSQPDAAAQALKAAGRPLSVRDLLPLVTQLGVVFAASDPVASLGSQLSRNPDRFESRRINGQSLWWLKFEPWPETADATGQTRIFDEE